MKFIKLTMQPTDCKIYINPDKIESIIDYIDACDDQPHSTVTPDSGTFFNVKETPKEIIEKINLLGEIK